MTDEILERSWEVDEPGPAKGVGSPKDWPDDAYFDRAANNSEGTWRLSHLMWLVASVALFFALVVWLGPWTIGAGILALIALAVASAVVLARQRTTQQDSLLHILAIAAERGMPLGSTVAAFADQYQGRYRHRILDLAALLEAGTPLPEALDQVPWIVSRDALLLVHVGQESNQLPRALRMAASSRASQLPIWSAIAGRFAYLLALLLAMQTICGFILYFIIPRFESIFKDFGVSLPTVTVWVIDSSHWLTRYGLITGWIPAIEVFLLVFLPFSFAGWINYDVPLFDRLLGRRHVALILRSLSLVVDGGKPIEAGLTALTSHYPTWRIRRKLIAVDGEVRHGGAWIDSLWRNGLIRSTDAEVLQSASRVGNLAWAMRELAETSERRLAFRFQAIVQTLFPLVVMGLGAVVFLLAFAFFSPLVELIRRLSDT